MWYRMGWIADIKASDITASQKKGFANNTTSEASVFFKFVDQLNSKAALRSCFQRD